VDITVSVICDMLVIVIPMKMSGTHVGEYWGEVGDHLGEVAE